MDCLCTFKSFNALKVHLAKLHTQTDIRQTNTAVALFHCQVCEYSDSCTETEFFTLVRRHLKLRQNVPCPYEGCDFETPVYSTFKAHKSRVHSECAAPFKPEVRTVASQDGDQQSENGEYGLSR